jgi:heterodisulfide reductase subunit B
MQRKGERLGIPVIYFTELLGLAMGYGAEELGMKLHRVSVDGFIEKWESLAEPEARSAAIAEGLNTAGPLI